jgi:DNA polymerase-3 subunit gamma/tau
MGQPAAVKALTNMAKQNRFPHALLFVGASGCGKTTLARITRTKLDCGDLDFVEMDSATNGGVDVVRMLQKRMGLSPKSGTTSVFLMDEAHMLSPAAQAAFLKILEDAKPHVYFMLATTDPQKLKETIKTRCTTVQVRPLRPVVMNTLIAKVLTKEKIEVAEQVIDKIIEYADGSARKALVLLNSIVGLSTKDQMEIILNSDVKKVAFDLVRMLMRQGVTWGKVSEFIAELEDDPEGLRRMVLGYSRKVLLGGKRGSERAYILIDAFRDNFFDSGKAGLAAACYEVVKGT